MIDFDLYSRDESWYGSYYELAIEVALEPSAEQLSAAVDALWESPRMEGPWREITFAERVQADIPEPGGGSRCYGVLTITGLGELPCVSRIVRELGDNSDWLAVGVPTHALHEHGLTHPVHESPAELIRQIDSAFVEIAVQVFTRAGFLLAAIGEETSGMFYSASLAGSDAAALGGFLIPQPLWEQVGHLPNPQTVAPGLMWVPSVTL